MSSPLDLAMGLELEFLAVYAPGALGPHIPNYASLKRRNPDPDVPLREAGPAIFHSLLRAGIPATGHEDLDDDEDEVDAAWPEHTRWRVEEDACALSDAERAALPAGYIVETIELSSRKFDLQADYWRAELRRVLDVLHYLETSSALPITTNTSSSSSSSSSSTMILPPSGCLFLTNATTGLHVHIGTVSGAPLPLPTAKNLLALATAFERPLDALHAASRIRYPVTETDPILYAPPSFFHLQHDLHEPPADTKPNPNPNPNPVPDNTSTAAPLFTWLARIEFAPTYPALASLLLIHDAVRFPLIVRGATLGLEGHRSAYNFDNCFGGGFRGWQAACTGTVEFRQHAGTLDWVEVVVWVGVVVGMVACARAGVERPAEFVGLLARGVDVGFGLEGVLGAFGVGEEVVDCLLGREEGVVGVLGSERVGGSLVPGGLQRFVRLVECNEAEQNERLGEEARAAVMRGKCYGYDISRREPFHVPVETVTALLEYYADVVRRQEGVTDTQEILSKAKIETLGCLRRLYDAGN